MSPLPPGAVIGVLGGGQLGRLLALDAARLGFDVHVYCPEADSPAARAAARETVAGYDDAAALARFAAGCDVVTYEFESVPVAAVAAVEAAGCPVRPGAKSLEKSQDRLVEKEFLNGIGIPTVAYAAIDAETTFDAALAGFGGRAILKTRRDGYDGKGQVRLDAADGKERLDQARDLAAAQPCLLEAFAPFEREISVVVARNETTCRAFEPGENGHENGILARSKAPADVAPRLRDEAIADGVKLADALGHIGVLALEFFVMPGGRLLANEFAPRVHNSGHWTVEACLTSQFEQHIRAVAGWPLGPATRIFDVEMENLLGDDIRDAPGAFDAADRLSLYGKRDAEPGRKMGHVTRRSGLASHGPNPVEDGS